MNWNISGWKEAAEDYHKQQEHNGGNGHERDQSDLVQFEIMRLAKLSVAAYETERAPAANRLRMRAAVLDRLVETERKAGDHDSRQGRALTLAEPQPWPHPVDGASLFHDLAAAIRRHVVMSEHAVDATALWVVHTYMLDALHISPRLAVTSPEKGCGKTTLLDVLTPLVWRPLAVANTTASPIFRAIDIQRPTLLIDEADTFLDGNEELRGILNSGHRRGGSALRTVGDDFEPRQFSTYSACAIALIGRLPGTLADRSVAIELQRRIDSEPIESFRLDRTGHLDELASKAARWAADNLDRLRDADPPMPPGIFNRAADNWRALLAIADAAGGEWPQRARRAAEAAQAAVEDNLARVQLLTDIKTAFMQRATDRLPSADLVDALIAMECRPWAEWKASKPLSQNGLARLLRSLKIRPGSIRIAAETPKGYYAAQFEDAFRRYLPQEGESQPPHRNKVDEMGTSSIFDPQHAAPSVADEKREKSNSDGHCCGVAVAKVDATADRRCDHCGSLGRAGDLLNLWNWPGWSDGPWLHQGCEAAWVESETQPGSVR